MKNVIVNLGGYGDFDMPYTEFSFLSPDGMSKGEVKVVCNTISSLFKNTKDVSCAVKEFKSQGFIVVNSVDCLDGGNL